MAVKLGQQPSLTEGALLPKIIKYTIPVALAGFLQLLFGCADNIVIGRYVGSDALAALGPTGPIVTLIVNVLLGLSTGAAICTAHSAGAGDDEDLSSVVHTALATSIIGGIIVGAAGILLTHQCLVWMSTPPELIGRSELYMKIYFCGLPFMMFFNFGAGILRSVGDTKNPLYYLVTGGILNVGLNLLFVIGFKMGVAGVAIATVMSQVASAALAAAHFIRSKEAYRLIPSRLRIDPKKLARILKFGIPAGLQGTVFSLSNVFIQSSVNIFGATAMSGNSAAVNLEGFVYTAMNSFYHAALTFTGQHIGAGKTERMRKVFRICLICVSVTGAALGTLMCIFGDRLLALYLPEDPAAVESGMKRLIIICSLYFFCGILEVLLGTVQGMGASMSPMFVSLFGAFVIRTIWIMTIFQHIKTLEVLYFCYPVSWIITVAAMFGLYFIFSKRLRHHGTINRI